MGDKQAAKATEERNDPDFLAKTSMTCLPQLKKFRPAKTARIAGENGRADRQNSRTIFIAN
jgi:hypothetical protein